MYVNDIKSGTTAKEGLMPDCGLQEESRTVFQTGSPSVVKQSPGTALVDGQNLLGPLVGQYCMDLAMEKAKKIGIGLVAARRSNHFGIAGYYALRAMDKNLIGWAVRTPSPPLNQQS